MADIIPGTTIHIMPENILLTYIQQYNSNHALAVDYYGQKLIVSNETFRPAKRGTTCVIP